MEDVCGLADAGADGVEKDKVGSGCEGGCDDDKIPVIFGDVCGSLFSVYCGVDEGEENGENAEIGRLGDLINWFLGIKGN